MHLTRILGKKSLAAGIGVVAALSAGGTAYAATNPGPAGPAPAGSGATNPAVHPKRPRTLLSRADHATVELKVKGQWVTYTLDRGKVTAVSPTSITLARPDGQNVTEAITATTRFGGVTSESAIQLNHRATVLSDNGSALRVDQGKPPSRSGPAGA